MSLFIRLCSLFTGTQTAVLPPVQNFSRLSLALLHVPKVHTVLCTEYPRHDSSSLEVSRRHRTEHEQKLEGWERRQVGERGIVQKECDNCTEMTGLLGYLSHRKLLEVSMLQPEAIPICSLNSTVLLFVWVFRDSQGTTQILIREITSISQLSTKIFSYTTPQLPLINLDAK